MTQSRHRAGFIGLGQMGGNIALRLLERGQTLVIVPGPKGSSVDELRRAGAVVAQSPRELAANVDIVFSCLPSSVEVESVASGPDGVLAGARPGLIHVDLTSGDPLRTMALAKPYQARGLELADAAIVGMPEQARAGALTLMVGASPETFARLQPLLGDISVRQMRTGPVGTAQKTKLIMSFLGMAMANAIAEVLTVARATDVPLETIHTMISGTGMDSATFQAMALAAMDGDVSRRKLSISNARKDVQCFLSMVDEKRLATLLAPATLQSLTLAVEAGHGDAFVPALTDILSKRNGISPDRSKS